MDGIRGCPSNHLGSRFSGSRHFCASNFRSSDSMAQAILWFNPFWPWRLVMWSSTAFFIRLAGRFVVSSRAGAEGRRCLIRCLPPRQEAKLPNAPPTIPKGLRQIPDSPRSVSPGWPRTRKNTRGYQNAPQKIAIASCICTLKLGSQGTTKDNRRHQQHKKRR